ncbi:hypothetical protein [Sharpea azabuensis]|uniref:hypothetical protein n=1 Tax=Sharpea azabuensis TaxID=322505 RepID=UPI00051B7D3E|nr:hypothetical protein [Sharpea azabuensis]
MKKRYIIQLFLVSLFSLIPLQSVSAKEAVSIEIPVELMLNKQHTQGQLELKATSPDDYLPSTNPITINGQGTITLNYTHTGTYTYQLHQLTGNDSAIKYDATVYHITVFIGTDTHVVTIYKEGSSDKDAKAIFNNVKDVPKTQTTTKKNTGKETKTGDSTPIMFYSVMTIVSLAIVFILLMRLKEDKKCIK